MQSGWELVPCDTTRWKSLRWSIYPFIHLARINWILCARHYSKCWWVAVNKTKSLLPRSSHWEETDIDQLKLSYSRWGYFSREIITWVRTLCADSIWAETCRKHRADLCGYPGREVSRQRYGLCNGPKVGTCVLCLGNIKETSVIGAE